MSTEQSEPEPLKSAYRTVTPPYGSGNDPELMGWVVFLGVMTLLFPLIPLFLVIVLGAKLFRAIRSTVQGPSE